LILVALISLVYCQSSYAQYCMDNTKFCNGTNTQYMTKDVCEQIAMKVKMPMGRSGDTSVNSLECRKYHTGVAKNSPIIHCPHGGPTGGDACGSWCEVYCQQYISTCNFLRYDYFDNLTICNNLCNKFMATTGMVGDKSGNTIQCRFYHLYAGIMYMDTKTHCLHAYLHGGDVCGNLNENYCSIVTKACTGRNAAFPGYKECVASTEFFASGAEADINSNSLYCRAYHAAAAGQWMDSSDYFCRAAGFYGGDTCGSYCDVYCNTIEKVCTGTHRQYEGKEQCMLACNQFDNSSPWGSTSGDSLQCRLYHLRVASYDSPTIHCPHAGKSGGGVCVN